ncbi:hypothetical protein [Specibacter sp. NPDC078709]|uniref:hypothetical protein n=1 Tax=Specibacter sp. NPDC078709 TaxID=3154364 RepID=UPI00342D4689
MGSLTATGCSLIPGVGDQSSDSGSGTDAGQPRDIGTDIGTDTGQSDTGADTDPDTLATELGDLGVLGGNAEACVSVTAVVITGSTLAFLAKIDPSGESSQKMADQVQESMKKVPAEIKGDLENLLKVINDSAVDGKTWDDTKFQKAMEPIGAWAKKNCGSE